METCQSQKENGKERGKKDDEAGVAARRIINSQQAATSVLVAGHVVSYAAQ